MIPIGVVKRMDRLGRILLPSDLRTAMNIKTDDPFEIFVDSDCIILKKYAPSCMFCNSCESVASFKGKNICATCLKELREIK